MNPRRQYQIPPSRLSQGLVDSGALTALSSPPRLPWWGRLLAGLLAVLMRAAEAGMRLARRR